MSTLKLYKGGDGLFHGLYTPGPEHRKLRLTEIYHPGHDAQCLRLDFNVPVRGYVHHFNFSVSYRDPAQRDAMIKRLKQNVLNWQYRRKYDQHQSYKILPWPGDCHGSPHFRTEFLDLEGAL